MEHPAFDKLTAAERSVLRCALGRTNDGVAAVLGVSPSTVATHILSARRKLGSPPRGEAARQFVAWESAQQKPTTPFPTMDDPAPEPQPERVDAELVREARSPFVFLEHSEPMARPTADHHQVMPLLRMVLVMTMVVLALASIRFLPDLRERAEQAGRALRPLLDRTGVDRSG